MLIALCHSKILYPVRFGNVKRLILELRIHLHIYREIANLSDSKNNH